MKGGNFLPPLLPVGPGKGWETPQHCLNLASETMAALHSSSTTLWSASWTSS